MKQYEIWWAQLSPSDGRRPVLLLSRDATYTYLNKYLAAEITTVIRKIKIEVPLSTADGMAKRCVVNCDNLRTIGKHALIEKISTLPAHRIVEVKRAIGYALGWEELIEA